jgi:hypothetical protein
MNKITKIVLIFLTSALLLFINNRGVVLAQSFTCLWFTHGGVGNCILDANNNECPQNGCTANCSQFTEQPACSGTHACTCQVNFDKLYNAIGFRTHTFNTIGGIVSESLLYIFPFAGLILLIFIIIGGFKYMTSAGNPKAAQSARGVLTTAFIGFIIIFLAYWLTLLIATILGLGQIKTIF